jgi:penicillin-binding protein 2
MCSRLANGQKALIPRLIKSIGGVEQPPGNAAPDLPFKPEHIAYVQGGMKAVANDTSGTAYRQSQLGLGDVMMAGKTGTAQVRSYDKVASRNSASVTWKLKDHNLFIAFAPYDAPRYAMAVIIEHGGLGGATAAAPRAREVMRTALLKDPEIRARITQQTNMPDASGADVEGAAPEGTVTTSASTDAPVNPADLAPAPPPPTPTGEAPR